MPDARVIQHLGKPIVRIDISGAERTDEVVATFARAKEIITSSPPGSVRALTNVTGARFNKAMVDALTDLAQHATPHLIASAGVGVTGLKEVVARGLFAVIGRRVELFRDEADALDWLSRH
jgi:hypothetical protein